MSLIAVVENILVKEKQLLSSADMLDAISLASVLPGPMAVNVVTYSGYKINGVSGAIASFCGVILPSFFLMIALCHFYTIIADQTLFKSFFQGVLPAVAAIIFQVAYRMAKKSLKFPVQYGLVVLAIICLLMIPKSMQLYSTFGLIFFAGIIGFFCFKEGETNTSDLAPLPTLKITFILSLIVIIITLSILPMPVAQNGLAKLWLTFSGLSLMLFGGGYVFIPMIQEVVVENFNWVTEQEFLDCIALGQITPGPIVISVTFIGYKVAGWLGAIVSTLAIFAPSAMLMVALSTFMDYFKHSQKVAAIMKGIRAVVIGMIAYAGFTVLFFLLPMETINIFGIIKVAILFFGALTALIRFNISILWVIPICGLLGCILASL